MRYLSSTCPSVPDHWYPADLTRRAQIDNVLDWHHDTLRYGGALFVINRAIAPALGNPSDAKAASGLEKVLRISLSNLETMWLKGNGRFLVNGSQPSIADLSLACQVMQLQLLGESAVSEFLGPLENVRKWLDAVEKALFPHFAEVNRSILELFQERSIKVQQAKKRSITSLAKL